ncbi:unnamed protein product [Prorocentrum cordatum]|uniref:Uncharacterized protein n=1 Tax=Prorocentrum cordatum TaxID=2364126 RepID=A0ABN9PDX8_9DINO|nr:unnamed protein product [Polarella glacialis]
MMQRDVLDVKGSKRFVTEHFDAMARSLQCPGSYCQPGVASTYCARLQPKAHWVVSGWAPKCPSEVKLGFFVHITIPKDHRVCYTPRCPTERCLRRVEGDPGSAACEPGVCLAEDERCEPTAACRQDTGGTCELLGCRRGTNSDMNMSFRRSAWISRIGDGPPLAAPPLARSARLGGGVQRLIREIRADLRTFMFKDSGFRNKNGVV